MRLFCRWLIHVGSEADGRILSLGYVVYVGFLPLLVVLMRMVGYEVEGREEVEGGC